jgi:HK97 family phage major capsid protein
MKSINWALTAALVATVALALGAGWLDLGTAAAGGMALANATVADLKKLEAALVEAFTKFGHNMKLTDSRVEKLGSEQKEIRREMIDIAQKYAQVPMGGSELPGFKGNQYLAAAQAMIEAEAVQQFVSRKTRSAAFALGGGFFNSPLRNPDPLSNDQPLTPSQREGSIIYDPTRPLRMRDILPARTTSSNFIEFAQEATASLNARPQGDASPVGHGEGELFGESTFTFSLANAPVITIGHRTSASMQILSDAGMLAEHLRTRLIFGFEDEVDSELLTGDGGGGKLNGINNQATAFDGGATNQDVFTTLSKAKMQLALANYVPNAVILHPRDFQSLETQKDGQNRFLLSNPAQATPPVVWGVPIVVTSEQTVGQFTMGDFNAAAAVWNREGPVVELSNSHDDYFARGLVMFRCWGRLALTVYRSSAIVKGSLSFAG